METHEAFEKNFFESNLKKKTTLPSHIHLILGQIMMNYS
jgi:hypothetical protein